MAARKKITFVISRPIQYHAPLYRYLTDHAPFDVHVIFHSDLGVRPYLEKNTGKVVSYGEHLLRGYSHEFLTRGEPGSIRERWRHRTLPGLESKILASEPAAVAFHGYNSIGHLRAITALHRRRIPVFYRAEHEDVLARPFLEHPLSWSYRKVVRERLLAYLFRRISAFLYIGKANREFYEHRGVNSERLFFVPYSADNDFFGIDIPPDKRRSIRAGLAAEFSFNKDAVLILSISKHRHEKRPLELMRGFVKATAELGAASPVWLILLGDGPLNGEMREIAAAGGGGNVCFAGFVDQAKMRDFLVAADYCINPGYEPWGCVFNEALPAGLGILSSDKVIGSWDLVREGKNGLIFHCGDVDSISRAIKECALHPEWIPSMRDESRKIARTYSFESCMHGLEKALQASSVSPEDTAAAAVSPV